MEQTEHLYGINPVFEALRAGRRELKLAYISDRGLESKGRLRTLMSLIERAGIPVERVDKGRLSQLCSSTEHQGAVLRVGLYPYVSFESLLGEPRLLLLDNIEDPHNAGAILRSAEVFGWRSVLMPSKGTPGVYPSVVKASAGATEHLRIARDHSAPRFCRRLLDEGYKIIALDSGGREGFDCLPKMEKAVLVIGGEHKAVGQFILNNSDHIVKIPERGRLSSLNASVAAGIALYELSKTDEARASST